MICLARDHHLLSKSPGLQLDVKDKMLHPALTSTKKRAQRSFGFFELWGQGVLCLRIPLQTNYWVTQKADSFRCIPDQERALQQVQAVNKLLWYLGLLIQHVQCARNSCGREGCSVESLASSGTELQHTPWGSGKRSFSLWLLGTILPGFRGCKPTKRWKGSTARGPWDHKPLRRQNLSSWQRHSPLLHLHGLGQVTG